MITHNGKYLVAATHHGMPIVAATMGGKMVIGWLQPATIQAIVAAFGAEGTEVIRKTNDYLNRIATTDPQRALQISGFINEDPMLVCSLVETSKTRWLVGDGKAYCNTGIVPNINSVAKCKYRITSINSGANGIFGCRNRYQSNEFMVWCYSDSIAVGWGNGNPQPTIVSQNYSGVHTVELSNGKFIYDGNVFTNSPSGSFTSNAEPCFIFCVNTGGAPDGQRAKAQDVAFFEMDGHTFVPYRDPSTGEMELLDILTGTLATRVGTFTEQLTSKTTETTS